MVIHPEVIVTPDCPTIKYRQPMEQVDLEKELPKILHAQGWGLGTYFHIQFTSHDRTQVICSGTFIVTASAESLQTNEDNPFQTVTKAVYSRKAEQVGEWWFPEGLRKHLDVAWTDELVEPPKDYSPSPEIKWNPGKKVHQVRVGDEVVFESADKLEAIQWAQEKAA